MFPRRHLGQGHGDGPEEVVAGHGVVVPALQYDNTELRRGQFLRRMELLRLRYGALASRTRDEALSASLRGGSREAITRLASQRRPLWWIIDIS